MARPVQHYLFFFFFNSLSVDGFLGLGGIACGWVIKRRKLKKVKTVEDEYIS